MTRMYRDGEGRRVCVNARPAGRTAPPRFIAVVEGPEGKRRPVEGLVSRGWFSEAQADLDALAEERGWKEIPWKL